MKRPDLPEAFRMLPNKIQGNGVQVLLLDSALPINTQKTHELQLHTLMIILEGAIAVQCNTTRELLKKDEAIMMKKDSVVQLTVPGENVDSFRCLAIFFDEPSLRYALMPFELSSNSPGHNLLKIPLNEKIKVFSDSILLYYKSNKGKNNWSMLLENKLRELVWIFFHTELKEQAKEFFGSPK
jgi:hypothetical protein